MELKNRVIQKEDKGTQTEDLTQKNYKENLTPQTNKTVGETENVESHKENVGIVEIQNGPENSNTVEAEQEDIIEDSGETNTDFFRVSKVVHLTSEH